MIAAVLKLEKSDVFEIGGACITLAIGLLLLYFGYAVGKEWYYAPPPSPRTFQLYITPQAEVVPAIEFQPGLPRVLVSMDEFIHASKGKPYIVSFSSYWKNGDRRGDYWNVTYSIDIQGPAGERYVYATQRIPDYSYAEAHGWRTETIYNADKQEFALQVVGVHWGSAVASVILALLGVIVTLFGSGWGMDTYARLKRLKHGIF